MPDYDATNAASTTMKFLNSSSGEGAMEPTCGIVSPPDANLVPHTNDVNDALRLRDFGVSFGWEKLGFLWYTRPIAKAFARLRCNDATTARGHGL